ncbi:protocadherin-23 [Dunckerocampus dactyliophorus]|uniref:protocadherin-23 n=1 Tax=Dunckerocampus dactyliophorus TaxID=161453 RepID=UPI0024050C83|nr:protocadherin-23 [Dunckerocampus dactyliophorus]XP_054634743.1 protocadherin-23 [Dunckerocampus dactyliophorus]XP_054634744.1 protocadherin-23 [Dunckerocampus dactyliophorus]
MYRQSLPMLLVLALLCTHSLAHLFNLTLSVKEGLPAKTIVGDLAAGLSRASTGFFISESQDSYVFRDLEIDADTGIISTAVVLDRETRGRYDFVAATLTGEMIRVRLEVDDVNDYSPVFPSEEVDLEVSELSPPGTRFHLEGARDQDEGDFGTQGYRIREAEMGDTFQLEQRGGATANHVSLDLVLMSKVDREAQDLYSLTIEAFDGGIPARTGTLRVNIRIVDENDNPPVFNQTEYHASVSENTPAGSSVCRVHATDLDLGDNARITYEINRRQSDPDQFFSVNQTTGVVHLNKALDFEALGFHELIVTARDNGAQPESSSTFVVVKVLNVNDNSPSISVLFLSETGEALVSEDAGIGDYVARISVSDPDLQGDRVSVALEGGNGKFTLTQTDDLLFALCVNAELDREDRDLYELKVHASDLGSPPLSSETVLLIKVSDTNDCPPVFEKDTLIVSITEDAPKGTSLIRMQAQDNDQGANADINYSILKSNRDSLVSIDAWSGLVTTAGDLDREIQAEVWFLVVAADRGEPALSSTATVTLLLEDVNDNEPVFLQRLYNVSVPEHSPPGSCFLQVVAEDADSPEFGTLVYSLSDQNQLFHINPHTGDLCFSQEIDRDAGQTVHDILVTAEDPGGLSAQTYVHVDMEDLNDNAPVFNPEGYTGSISSHAQPGTEILNVIATDADSGSFGGVTYGILPGDLSALFAIDPQTGILYLTSTLTHLGGVASVKLTINAQDGGGVSSARPAEVTVNILVSAQAPAVFQRSRYTFSVPEDATPGTSVGTVRATTSTDSVDSVSYRISSGDLPGWFAVHATSGQIISVKPLDHESLPCALLFLQAYTDSSPIYSTTQVNITIADVNDVAPVFPKLRDAITVSQNTPPGTVLFIAHAHDYDSGANGRVFYYLRGRSYNGAFVLDPDLGTVTLNQSLQEDPRQRYDLDIVAEDEGDPPLSATLTLTVNVDRTTSSDSLAFETLVYQVEIGEGYRKDSRVIQVRAHPSRGASQSAITYSLEDEKAFPPAPFRIHPKTGWLYLSDNLDYETESTYHFGVLATVKDTNATATVMVLVLDINDNTPEFSSNVYYFTLSEGLPPQGLVGQVKATDKDSGKNAQLSHMLLSDGKFFRINDKTGEIMNWVALDREQHNQHTLKVMVTDQGSPRLNATAIVHVLVTDINDNAPQFTHLPASKERNVQVSAGIPTGSLVTNVFAKDSDAGENGTVTFTLVTLGAQGQRLGHFEIDGKSGDIRTTSLFEHNVGASYTLEVTARDGGRSPLEDAALIHVQVHGDEAQFGHSESPVVRRLSVREDAPPATVIGSASVWGEGKFHYSITEGDGSVHFGIDGESGDIYVCQPLDYESAVQFTLTVLAEDECGTGNVTVQVFVTVDDVNDHAPWFPDELVTFGLREDAAIGSLAFAFHARDADGTYTNSALRYSLTFHPSRSGLSSSFPFQMNPRTGSLTVAAPLDRETSPAYALTVTASDQSERRDERRCTSVTALVFLLDVNDERPVFVSAEAVQVMEDAAAGSFVHHFVATDGDEGDNGLVSYVILAGNTKGLFSLEEDTGLLRLSAPLDFETERFHRLTVGAVDRGRPARSSTQTLTVDVVDVNDRPPVFSRDVYAASVSENREPGEAVVRVSATDEDSEDNAVVWYSLLPGPGYEFFSINPYSGLISTSSFLDREQQQQFTLRVQARDSGARPLSGTATVHCSVLDDNDNPPDFMQSFFQISLPENLPPGVVHTAQAYDPDRGENGTIHYSIQGEDYRGVFTIDSHSGVVRTMQVLDREDKQNYTLTIHARDGGASPLSSIMQLQLVLLDRNDNTPTFTRKSYHASLSEGLSAGVQVLSVTALDPDEGSNGDVAYSLTEDSSQGAFSVDVSTGMIRTTRALDRESRAQFSLRVVATDGCTRGPLNSFASVTIQVEDVNDNVPLCENPIDTFISTRTLPNHILTTVTATDADRGPNGTVRFSLSHDGNLFDINSESGDISLRRRVRAGLSVKKLQVQVSDRGLPALTSSCLVFVHLKGEPEGLQFAHKVYNATIQENSRAGTWITTVDASDPTSSGQGTSYSIFSSDNVFSIDRHTGEIRVQKDHALDFEVSPRMELLVLADNGVQTAHCKVVVGLQDANDNAPLFEQGAYRSAVWEGQVHNTYIMQVFASDADSGMNGQMDFSIVSGNHNDAFILDSVRGILATNTLLDREITPCYELVVQAADRGNPPLSSTTTIRVRVVDINDNIPAIPPMEPVLMAENLPAGSVVTQVTANDVDLNPAIVYSFSHNASTHGPFAVDPYTGMVTLTQALDFEAENTEYNLTVWAFDSLHQSSGQVRVQVLDVNDHAPVFAQVSYQVELSELVPQDTFVVNVSAADRDSGLNGKVTYRLLSSPLEGFYINADSGSLFTSKPMKSNSNRIHLLVEARDGGDPLRSTITSIDVLILDTNDHAPLFHQDVYTVSVSEDTPTGAMLLTLFASDQDWSPENTYLDYAIKEGNEGKQFCLEAKATQVENQMKNVCKLVLCGPLDRETTESYVLTVSVSDRGTPALNSSAIVRVTVTDCNDNAPAFSSTEYHAQVSESSRVGTSLVQVRAHDLDLGINGLLRYDIVSGDSRGRLKLDAQSGLLVVNATLDYEEDSRYSLTIRASDGGESSEDGKVAFTVVYITVLDENDNSPYFLFSTFNCSVLENLPAFTHICSVHAVDNDLGLYGQLTYSILSSCFVDFGDSSLDRKEAFAIDPHTGEVHTRQTFDYEQESEHCFVVEARDKGDKAATVRVQISIKGVDEFSPVFTQKQYHFPLPKDAKSRETVGFVTAMDHDRGVDGVVEYTLVNPPPFFSMNKTIGAIYLSGPVLRRRGGHVSEDELELLVLAASPRLGSRTTSCQVFVNISSSAKALVGVPLDGHMLSLSVSLAIFLLFLIIFVSLVLRSKMKEAALRKAASVASNMNHGSFGRSDCAISLQGMKPSILVSKCDAANRYTPSNSSGRGSAEGETAEDQEIKWINEYPCRKSDEPLQENWTSENPDSALPGDTMSCHSVGVGPEHILSVSLVSGLASTESLHHFKEEGGGEGLLPAAIRGRDLEGKRGYAVLSEALASSDSLSSLMRLDERLEGGYTWNYLLDWEPCFQNLASVFTDIGMLPDEDLQGGREDLATLADIGSLMHPPPLITSVAQPGIRTVPPRKPHRTQSTRIRPSYPRYAYSPLARNTGLTPTAMTPTFSPSLSSLTIRTPTVSPVVSDTGVGGIRLDSGPLTASLLEAEIQV